VLQHKQLRDREKSTRGERRRRKFHSNHIYFTFGPRLEKPSSFKQFLLALQLVFHLLYQHFFTSFVSLSSSSSSPYFSLFCAPVDTQKVLNTKHTHNFILCYSDLESYKKKNIQRAFTHNLKNSRLYVCV